MLKYAKFSFALILKMLVLTTFMLAGVRGADVSYEVEISNQGSEAINTIRTEISTPDSREAVSSEPPSA